jgi:hypothetical protein
MKRLLQNRLALARVGAERAETTRELYFFVEQIKRLQRLLEGC